MRKFFFVFLLTLVSQAGGAVKYFPANDSQPLIRRDLLPLDVDAIRELADHLTVLADGPAPPSASLLRNRVQAITLSERLSPAQPRAREILSALARGEPRPKPTNQETQAAKRHILSTAGWLTKLPADSEGHHLGQLLLDILPPITANQAPILPHNTKDAAKRWKGVVAQVTAFKLREKKPIIKAPTVPEKKPPQGPDYITTALLTEVPMLAQGLAKDAQPAPALIKTSLVITKSDTAGELRFQPNPGFPTKPLQGALVKFFQSIDQPLPKNRNLNINTDRQRYLQKNRENIAAPLAMMLDAALTGRTLRPNTLFFARLRADGSLDKPTEAWHLLLHLEKLLVPNGSRIIVGSGMLEEMTALLVLQKASFFTNYEVIEASDFKSARELFYDDGQPSPDLAAAIAAYQKVRTQANLATNLNSFLSLSSVESHLIKARDLFPQHLSARMLASQAIRRPAYFSRFMFAQELDSRLQKISTLKYIPNETPERAIKDAYKEVRETLEPLERLIKRSERMILEDTLDLLKKLNSVGRGATSPLFSEQRQTRLDLKSFQAELTTFRGKLRETYQPSEKK